MNFTDPNQLEDYLRPIVGDISIRPEKGIDFEMQLEKYPLEKVGIFRLRGGSLHAKKEPQNKFMGITVPLTAPIKIATSKGDLNLSSGNSHILRPRDGFDCRCPDQTDVLSCNLYLQPLLKYAAEVTGTSRDELSFNDAELSFTYPRNSLLIRTILLTWNMINNKKISDIEITELEDNLLMGMVNLSEPQDIKISGKNELYLSRAEEFINANLSSPITRDCLVKATGSSIRSLSRVFEKKYGFGPMFFLRQRRFDAALSDLLKLNKSDTSVTRIAYKYGFSHPGKFAIEYRSIFGESPYDTLSK